jgi:hypothetical protein
VLDCLQVKERRGDLNHESVYVLRVLHDFMEHGGCEAVIERFRKAPLQVWLPPDVPLLTKASGAMWRFLTKVG